MRRNESQETAKPFLVKEPKTFPTFLPFLLLGSPPMNTDFSHLFTDLPPLPSKPLVNVSRLTANESRQN